MAGRVGNDLVSPKVKKWRAAELFVGSVSRSENVPVLFCGFEFGVECSGFWVSTITSSTRKSLTGHMTSYVPAGCISRRIWLSVVGLRD